MKISVIQCTARYGGIDILQKSMDHQTYKNFEVIVVDELNRTYPRDYMKVVKPPIKKEGMYWNLCASVNEGIRKSTGEMIVLLQDYIYVPPDGLQNYVNRWEIEGPCLISGVGHQYELPNYADAINGLYSVWNEWPGEPNGEIVFKDPRMDKKGFYLSHPLEWEANWGCLPRKAWVEIGGWDEELDAGWGYDNVNTAERCQLAGYNIFVDTFNEVKCYSHINILNEHKKRAEAPNNDHLWHNKYRDMRKGDSSWKLKYA